MVSAWLGVAAVWVGTTGQRRKWDWAEPGGEPRLRLPARPDHGNGHRGQWSISEQRRGCQCIISRLQCLPSTSPKVASGPAHMHLGNSSYLPSCRSDEQRFLPGLTSVCRPEWHGELSLKNRPSFQPDQPSPLTRHAGRIQRDRYRVSRATLSSFVSCKLISQRNPDSPYCQIGHLIQGGFLTVPPFWPLVKSASSLWWNNPPFTFQLMWFSWCPVLSPVPGWLTRTL